MAESRPILTAGAALAKIELDLRWWRSEVEAGRHGITRDTIQSIIEDVLLTCRQVQRSKEAARG